VSPGPQHLTVTEVETLAALIRARAVRLARPCLVAMDGRSGSGKSTLAARLGGMLGASVVDGDGFFAGGIEVRHDSARARACDCIDWRRQRPVLETLRAGSTARYFAFDWEAFDGRLERQPTVVEARPVVIVEGVYAARPELADLYDLLVLVCVTERTRHRRLVAREGSIGPWEAQWHEAEEWYFGEAAPPARFDVIVEGDD